MKPFHNAEYWFFYSVFLMSLFFSFLFGVGEQESVAIFFDRAALPMYFVSPWIGFFITPLVLFCIAFFLQWRRDEGEDVAPRWKLMLALSSTFLFFYHLCFLFISVRHNYTFIPNIFFFSVHGVVLLYALSLFLAKGRDFFIFPLSFQESLDFTARARRQKMAWLLLGTSFLGYLITFLWLPGNSFVFLLFCIVYAVLFLQDSLLRTIYTKLFYSKYIQYCIKKIFHKK